MWGRRHQYVNLSFLGIFTFTAPYLPWVLLAFSGRWLTRPCRGRCRGAWRVGGHSSWSQRLICLAIDSSGVAGGLTLFRELHKAAQAAAVRVARPPCVGGCALAPATPPHHLPHAVMLGSSPLMDLLGMVAGHAYYFLEDVYPRMTNRRLLRTPAIVRALFPAEGLQAPRMAAAPPLVAAGGPGGGALAPAAAAAPAAQQQQPDQQPGVPAAVGDDGQRPHTD